jgi:hypothetical protein
MSNNVVVLSDSHATVDDHRRVFEEEFGVSMKDVGEQNRSVYQGVLQDKGWVTLYGDADFDDSEGVPFSEFRVVFSIDHAELPGAIPMAQRVASHIAMVLRCRTIVTVEFGKPVATYDRRNLSERQ